MSVYVIYSSTSLLRPAFLCVCADVFVLCPSLGIQSRSIFVPHISHQYFTPSLPLLASFPLSFLGIRMRFYLCSTTHYWRTGWLESRWDDMSCVWCCKETATARWLQTILLLFVFNLYLPTVGWQGTTHARALFSYTRRTCPVQAVSLTLGHLTSPLKRWQSRAGQSMIAVEYSFVQFHPPGMSNDIPPAESIRAAPSTLMTPHRQETEGGLKEQRPHVAQHNSSIPPYWWTRADATNVAEAPNV